MRGHARGPFGTNSNLRVQNVIILGPGDVVQLPVEASPTDPVLLKITPYIASAITGGNVSLLVGNPSSENAYLASGDTTPGTPGLATEKKYVLLASTTLIAKLVATAIAASKALTITAITGADTQTVTIGGQTYTLHTSLSGFTSTPNAVLIGADATAMGNNLAAAINGGAGAGTVYGTGTVANASVTATAAAGVVTATAKVAGSGGNSIAIAETLTNGAWAGGATTLSGGADAASNGQAMLFMDA